MTTDELPADMEARTPAPEGEAVAALRAIVRDCLANDFNELWDSYTAAQAVLAASPVVPVGVSREDIARLLHAIVDSDGTLVRVEEAVDAILAALRPTDTGWRDIATAPRDGTDVLVCDDETGERHVSYWTGDCWSGRNRFKPTHWMPLPPAPTDTGREV